MIEAQGFGSLGGWSYYFIDTSVDPGQTYYYWLEFVQVDGNVLHQEPVSADGPFVTYLPMVARPEESPDT